MPPLGDYILTNIGFSRDEKPVLLLQNGDTFIEFLPVGHQFSLAFDMTLRHCTGWRDITKGERHACPDHAIVDQKYEQCRECQVRTGFNPAFYHASSISEQQEARNQQPHILYLAHFGPGIIKIGISLAARGHSRLLEQGARTAIILDTFPSAHIARHYEEQIAKLRGISETIQLSKKLSTLKHTYDNTLAAVELQAVRQTVEQQLNVSFAGSDILHLDEIYFTGAAFDYRQAVDLTSSHRISGGAIGMIGSVLCMKQSDASLIFALKKHVGYQVSIDTTAFDLALPAQQTSLF